LVILRPRALDFDLVLADAGTRPIAGNEFWEMGRKQALQVANRLEEGLQAWAAGGQGQLQIVDDALGFRLSAEAGPFTLLVCKRIPGQPYAASIFRDRVEAEQIRLRLAPVLFPRDGAEQEYYLNTREFGR
jgi:hypothetical protein